MTILRHLPSLPRPIRLLAGAGVLIACVQLIAACGSSSHASTTAQTRIGPESIFEAGSQLSTAPAAGLDTLRKLDGVRLVTYTLGTTRPPRPASGTAAAMGPADDDDDLDEELDDSADFR